MIPSAPYRATSRPSASGRQALIREPDPGHFRKCERWPKTARRRTSGSLASDRNFPSCNLLSSLWNSNSCFKGGGHFHKEDRRLQEVGISIEAFLNSNSEGIQEVDHADPLTDRIALPLAWIPIQKKKPNISPEFVPYFRYNRLSSVVFWIHQYTKFHAVRILIQIH